MLVDLYPRVHRRYSSLAILGPIPCRPCALTRKQAGKTVTRIIPAQAGPQTQARLAEYRRFRQLSKMFIEVNDAQSEARLATGSAPKKPQTAVIAESLAAEAAREIERLLGADATQTLGDFEAAETAVHTAVLAVAAPFVAERLNADHSAGARDRSRRTPSRRAGDAPRKTYPVSRRRRYGHSRAQGRNRAAPRQAARRFGQNPRGQARRRLDGRTPSPQDRHPDARPGLNLLHGRYRDGRQSRYRPRTLPLRPARLPRSRTPPFRRCRPQGHPRRRRPGSGPSPTSVSPMRSRSSTSSTPKATSGTSPRPSTHPGPTSPRLPTSGTVDRRVSRLEGRIDGWYDRPSAPMPAPDPSD